MLYRRDRRWNGAQSFVTAAVATVLAAAAAGLLMQACVPGPPDESEAPTGPGGSDPVPGAPAPGPPPAPAPAPGGLVVATVSTSGKEPDRDGYLISLEGYEPRRVGVNDAVSFTDVAIGERLVTLDDVSEDCKLKGDNPMTVDVEEGREARAKFSLTCND